MSFDGGLSNIMNEYEMEKSSVVVDSEYGYITHSLHLF
jgi:hypothetical protein